MLELQSRQPYACQCQLYKSYPIHSQKSTTFSLSRLYLLQSHLASSCCSSPLHLLQSVCPISSTAIRTTPSESPLQARACRRAAWQSASNHDIFCSALWHTFTIWQWVSSRSVSTRWQSSARSSTDEFLTASRLVHSLDAAKSDANASHNNLFTFKSETDKSMISDRLLPVWMPGISVLLPVMCVCPAVWVCSVMWWTNPNDFSRWWRQTALGSSFWSTWTLKSQQMTTGQLYVANYSNCRLIIKHGRYRLVVGP